MYIYIMMLLSTETFLSLLSLCVMFGLDIGCGSIDRRFFRRYFSSLFIVSAPFFSRNFDPDLIISPYRQFVIYFYLSTLDSAKDFIREGIRWIILQRGEWIIKWRKPLPYINRFCTVVVLFIFICWKYRWSLLTSAEYTSTIYLYYNMEVADTLCLSG